MDNGFKSLMQERLLPTLLPYAVLRCSAGCCVHAASHGATLCHTHCSARQNH